MKKIIFTLLVVFSFFIMPEVKADTTYVKGIMTDTNVGLRRVSNNDSDRMKDDEGKNIALYAPETFEILGEEGEYYKINVQYKGRYYTGYVPKRYSAKIATYTVKDTTVQDMRNLGFDDTYAYKLAVLKTIYPSWTFIPYYTDLDFTYVISKEAIPVSKNLIQSTNTSLYSTEDGALDANGNFKAFDNGTWFAASKQTIGYYLDPRNFLNESHVFMFEDLKYNLNAHPSSTPAVNEIVRATFMDPAHVNYKKAFACKEGYGICVNNDEAQIPKTYSEIFLEAGNTHNVSPVHLATRVYQEQGANGRSSIISGNGYEGNYVGYYNYFNVGASGNGAGTIITAALSNAQNRGWNSPYASIIGGTEFIRKNYIGVDQDTIYFQKFDVVKPAGFSHQYMQNIGAPYSESYLTYTAYARGNIMELPYIFKVPVYQNMPAFTTLNIEGSDDANLSSLSVSGCSLMPTFTSSAVNYTCTVTKDVTSVNVSAVAASKSASISGTGQINIPNLENNLDITVTSGSGKIKVYTVKIKKVDINELAPDEIIARMQINNNSGVLSGFTLGTTGADLVNNIKSANPGATATASNNNILGTGTQITINNNGSKTYTVLVYGDNNSDGIIDILDLLKIQKHILGAAKLSDIYYKAADVNRDGTVDILDLLIVQKNILGALTINQ